MRPPLQGAYLSLSAAAVREFFDAGTRGLRLRTAGDVITMKGVATTSGTDVVSVEERGRGGLFAHIDAEGRGSDELLSLFRQAGYRSTAPYFLLRRRPRDWVGIEHWKSQKPPLNQPFIRVWMSDARSRGRKMTPVSRRTRRAAESDTSERIDWLQMRRVLSADKATLSRPSNDGRSNPRRTMARRNLEQFERLAELILPERKNTEALQNRLERMQEQLDQAEQERHSALEELVALQRVLDGERRERGSAPERNERAERTERPVRERRRGRREFQQPQVTEEDILAVEDPSAVDDPAAVHVENPGVDDAVASPTGDVSIETEAEMSPTQETVTESPEVETEDKPDFDEENEDLEEGNGEDDPQALDPNEEPMDVAVTGEDESPESAPEGNETHETNEHVTGEEEQPSMDDIEFPYDKH